VTGSGSPDRLFTLQNTGFYLAISTAPVAASFLFAVPTTGIIGHPAPVGGSASLVGIPFVCGAFRVIWRRA
jgi:hypothetical protein